MHRHAFAQFHQLAYRHSARAAWQVGQNLSTPRRFAPPWTGRRFDSKMINYDMADEPSETMPEDVRQAFIDAVRLFKRGSLTRPHLLYASEL
jgi:hypothetical protein